MRRRIAAGLLCLLLLGASGVLPAAHAAGEVTDTLTVKVGYWGMETERYADVGTYHWSQLYSDLELHQQAYSFYRLNADGVYSTVIDSAYGFYISDLLDYANIYTADVQSIEFYTKDQSIGYFTSFTYAELFQTQRYYFDDLAAQIQPVYDEHGNLTGYNGDSAWNSCTLVEPMLALEDSWISYEIGTEHTAPNFSSLGTGNRFRLLFGQASPLESRANQTAKYTHTVYVTLNGAPSFTEQPELDTTIGAHETALTVSVDNTSLRDALQDMLEFDSSDESVLEITGWTVVPSDEYSDLAQIVLSYNVKSEGTVTVSTRFGGVAFGSAQQIQTGAPQDGDDPGDDPAGDDGSGERNPDSNGQDVPEKDPDGTDEPSGNDPDNADPTTQPPAATQPSATTQPSTTAKQPSTTTQPPATTQPSTTAKRPDTADGTAEKQPEGGDAAAPVEQEITLSAPEQPTDAAPRQMLVLPHEIARRLLTQQSEPDETEAAQEAVRTPAVLPPDEGMPLALGMGTGAFGLFGAFCACVYYRKAR